MNKKLKHVEKGDWIALVNGQGEIFPWQVTHIAFKNKQVWDMELMNQKGERKAFSFLDEEMEVQTMERPDVICPHCGR